MRRNPPAGALAAIAVLILAPIVALMWVGSYAKETPRLWGMPFFFWYQFLWVFVAALTTFVAYRILIATTGEQGALGPGDVRPGDVRPGDVRRDPARPWDTDDSRGGERP